MSTHFQSYVEIYHHHGFFVEHRKVYHFAGFSVDFLACNVDRVGHSVAKPDYWEDGDSSVCNELYV